MPLDSSLTKSIMPGCKLANMSQRLKCTISGVYLHPLAETRFNLSKQNANIHPQARYLQTRIMQRPHLSSIA